MPRNITNCVSKCILLIVREPFFTVSLFLFYFQGKLKLNHPSKEIVGQILGKSGAGINLSVSIRNVFHMHVNE